MVRVTFFIKSISIHTSVDMEYLLVVRGRIFKVDELVSQVFGVCFDSNVTMKFVFGRVQCVGEALALVGFTYDNSFIQSRINGFWRNIVFVET